MNRRQFLHMLSGGAGALALPAWAAAPKKLDQSPVALVQLVNFGCGQSRAMETFYEEIKKTAASANIDFRVAPVAWVSQGLHADLVYYAAKDLYPNLEVIVRRILFDAFQRDGVQFQDLLQVMVYLRQNSDMQHLLEKNPTISVADWLEYASGQNPKLSEYKAIRLLERSGATEMPAFLWLSQGQVIHREFIREGNVSQLAQNVLLTLNPRLTDPDADDAPAKS